MSDNPKEKLVKVILRCGLQAGSSAAEISEALKWGVRHMMDNSITAQHMKNEYELKPDVAAIFDFMNTLKAVERLELGREKATYLMDLLAGDEELCAMYQTYAVGYGLDEGFLQKVFAKLGFTWKHTPPGGTKSTRDGFYLETEMGPRGDYWGANFYIDGLKVAQVTMITAHVRAICQHLRDAGIVVQTDEIPF